jgi:phosphoenolpyruvate synthase/pyruvate phosphate dikinase
LQVEKCFLDYVSKEALAIQHFALDDSATKYQQLIDEKKAILADLDRRIVKLTDAIEESDERVPVRSRLDERLRQKKALEAEINTLIGQLHSKSNTVSIASLVSGWVLSLRQAGLNVSVSQQLQEKIAIEQNRMFGDRYKLREALRNSVKGISIDIKAKTLYVVWNNNAKSAIEMKCKRMGQAKAVYMYRSKTNDNSYTDWVNIGSIMGSKQNTTNV